MTADLIRNFVFTRRLAAFLLLPPSYLAPCSGLGFRGESLVVSASNNLEDLY